MISLGIYNESTLYDKFINQDGFQLKEIDNITDLSALSTIDLILINLSRVEEKEYVYFLHNIRKLNNTKVIFIHETYSTELVKKLMYFGAYDCLNSPLHIPDLSILLKAAYTDLKKERRQHIKRREYEVNSIRESLAYDLLHGNTKHAKEIWERSQLANLAVIPNLVLLLSIDHYSKLIRNKGELWKNSIREEVLEAIQHCDLQEEIVKVLVDEQKYALLLSLPVQLEEEKYKDTAIEYAEKIRDEVNKRTDYTVTIGIGNYYEDARNLHLSFQESEQAQAYRLFQAENSIIHINDLDYFDTPEYDEYKVQIQEMTNKFSLGDIQAVQTIWEDIYHSVSIHSNLQPEEFRLQVLDLLFSLSRSAMHNGANPKHIMPLQIKYAKELHEIESLVEINTWIELIVNEYVSYVNEGHNEQVLKSVQEVLQFVEQHYDEDIGLDIIADRVNLSPNYLSAIFKQTTGNSFIDYLTNLRINKAKEKLQDLNLPVYEIAEKVGYSSSQYFSRVFKKHVGMTPSVYRNGLLSIKK